MPPMKRRSKRKQKISSPQDANKHAPPSSLESNITPGSSCLLKGSTPMMEVLFPIISTAFSSLLANVHWLCPHSLLNIKPFKIIDVYVMSV